MKSLLKTLSELNVKIDVENGNLRINAPAGVMTPELQQQLREHKQALIALLGQAWQDDGNDELPRIVPDPANRHQPFPLNDVQHAYWIGRQTHFDLGNVSTHFYFELDCEGIDLARLEQAFNKVIAQHDMLRAVTDRDGQQRVLAEVPDYRIALHDLADAGAAKQDAELHRMRGEQSERVIASDCWPLFQITAARLDTQRTRLFLSWDFIFLDAWSILLIFKEWHACYLDANRVPPELTLSFRDYVLAEARLKELPAYQRARNYWWDRIDQLPAAPMLPVVSKPPAGRQQFQRRRFVLPAAQWEALKTGARQRGITPSSILLSTFAEILNRWSKSDHYCLNLTIFNRQPMHEDVNRLVGDFTNLMVLEIDGRGKKRFVERAVHIQEQFLRDYDHRELSAIEVLREMAKRRGAQGQAILPVVFTSTLMLNGSRSDDSGGLERFGPMVWGISQTPQVWLDYQIFEVDGSLVFNWDAVEDMFLPGVLDDMFSANRTLVETLAKSAHLWESEQVTALPALQADVRGLVNQTAAEHAPVCLHSPFVTQALARPQQVAVECGTTTLTYGQLLAHADAMARELVAQGVQPNELVAVVMDKGWQQVVAVMAILLAGAAYLPLDPRWPALRRSQIMQRCKVGVVMVADGQAERLELPSGLRLMTVSAGENCAPVKEVPPTLQSERDLAYVIFTSGSTGEPKGVVIDHRGAVNTCVHVNRLFGVTADDRVLGVSELGFDLSVYDIFGVLGAGGTLVIPSASREPAHWRELVAKHAVTIWNSAPQLMNLLVDTAESQSGPSLASLRLVMMSGDWIPTRLPDRIRQLAPQADVISLGGATEGSIWSIYYRIGAVDPAWESIPYGKPLPNQHMYVLNKTMQPCPDLVVGDIYIGGIGVALGYWNDEEKTAQRFVRHPSTGEMLYWTGDLGRYLADGNIEFLGREDNQVKLRGYRVELGEIAAQLQMHPDVRESAVQVLRQDGRSVLVGYVVAEKGVAAPEPAALAAFLAERLPDYMVPQRFVHCASFPLSANGKVDLAALPKDLATVGGERRQLVSPESALQASILAIWTEVLGIEGLSTTDNFFEAGGDSLLLTTVLRRLNAQQGGSLTMAELFSYPTIRSLAAYLGGQEPANAAPVAPVQSAAANGDIAIIGMAGRFPDADSTERLWERLAAGHCAVRQFGDEELLAAGVDPQQLAQPNYVKAGPVLADMDKFDAAYFGMPPSEATFMDPQQRFLLECATEALEDAGYTSEARAGRIGVFVGKGTPRYMIDHLLPDAASVRHYGMFTILNGHDKDHAATVVSYKLNLTGPSLSINTSCSSSLVAVHQACQSLRSGECETALAGGVSFMSTLEKEGYLYEEGGITSPDGYCRAFSEQSNGVVFGSGVGVIVLKPLASALRDRDTIHAVIKGSAVNNDGASKVGYTAPSVHGQAKVIADAQARAGVTPAMIGYVETHGTGTNLGDPIEVAALSKVFGGARTDGSKVVIGSLKSNIGHLDVAAGIGGLIKVALALRHGQIPATLHAAQTNSKIDFAASAFAVSQALTPWMRGESPRTAGVSSFGVGGTNAHAVLQEAPVRAPRKAASGPFMLPLSARTDVALQEASMLLADHLERHPGIALDDVAYTLQAGRTAHRQRRHVVAASAAEAISALRAGSASSNAPADAPPLVFLLPGQGAQKAGATASLYRDSEAFRTAFDRCADLVDAYAGIDLRAVVYGDQGSIIDSTEVTQPLLFSLEYAMAEHWMALGLRPAALLGHSVGEYVAACMAGVFSLEEALSLVIVRGQLIASLDKGSMLAVACTEAELTPLLARSGCDLAAVNGPMQCVASGPDECIEILRAQLDQEGYASRVLATSHAFHSAMMDPILDTFEACVAQVVRNQPALPFMSSVTGQWITAEQATDPAYWTAHLRKAVRFSDGLACLAGMGKVQLLEVGPGQTLTKLARAAGLPAIASIGSGDEAVSLCMALGQLWEAGLEIDWERTNRSAAGRIPLPTYPFERQRHWVAHGGARQLQTVAATSSVVPVTETAAPIAALPDAPSNPIEEKLAAIWKEFLGLPHIGVNENFFSLGGDSLMAVRLYGRVKKEFDVELPRQKMFDLATIKRLYLFIVTTKDIDAVERLSEAELDEFQALIGA